MRDVFKYTFQLILCLIGWHAWDGNTTADYPPPRCTACGDWHYRKFPVGMVMLRNIFRIIIVVNLYIAILCWNTHGHPVLGICICLAGIIGIIGNRVMTVKMQRLVANAR